MHCHIFIIPSVDQEKQQEALDDYIYQYHMYIIYIYYYIILYSIIYYHMLYIFIIPSVDQEKQQEALEDLSSQLKPLLGDSGMMDSNLVGSFVPR